jgi:hypothetical protein
MDGDGFANAACGGTDCNDSDPEINPGEEDICGDGVDQDCSGSDEECGKPEGGCGCGGLYRPGSSRGGYGGGDRAAVCWLLPAVFGLYRFRRCRAFLGR